MSNIAKKFTKILSVIFLAAFLSSCDGGCVSADEFSGEFVTVKSYPGADKIQGTYSGISVDENGDITGGQRIEWTDTGLRSNGEPFLIQITGEWTPWFGRITNADSLNTMPRCNFCTKKPGVNNCICHKGQVSVPEISDDNFNPVSAKCSGPEPGDSADEEIAESCTCTTTSGLATDYTSYHLPLNYGDKFGNEKPSNEQVICKYDGGMGLYIGLFGQSGNDVPIRAYHLFTEDRVCDIELDSDGNCIDDNGRDVSKYVYRSPNNTIFVKDDNHGNSSDDDYYGAGATMHAPNEVVKLIIQDSYYSDNNGSYNVVFYNGVGGAGDGKGLLEFIVSTVEDAVLGDVDETTCVFDLEYNKKRCERAGGIIEFMYKSLVTDSGFILMVQLLLSLYITFYGLGILMGVAEINKKELMKRTLKICLLIAFISPTSWGLYNEIVVHFFKNGMDSVVGLIMDTSDSYLYSPDPTQSSSLILAQMDRAVDVSNSTRFAYIDTVIDKLMSLAVAKKVFGLFFADFFGFLYIPIIYFLIAFFIYTMLLAASFYLVNVMKIIFVLALGPLFMCFSLFGQTNGIFKKWIAFLGSRSLEILFLFLILYNFVLILDQKFNDLLYYSSCVKSWGIAGAKLKILEADVNRSISTWFVHFIAIGGLTFITKMIINQVPYIAGYLISIGEESNKDADGAGRGQSSMGLTNQMMGRSGLLGASVAGMKLGASVAYNGAGVGIQAGTAAYRTAKSSVVRTGVGKAIANSPIGKAASFANKFNPYRLRDAYRNSIIDAEIKKYTQEAQKKGLTGQAADMHIRKGVYGALQKKMHREWNNDSKKGSKVYDPTGMKIADINMTSIGRRLEQKLVDEALKNHIKQQAQAIKSSGNPLLGTQMREALVNDAKEWAKKNLAVDAKTIDAKLSGDLKGVIKKQSSYTADEGAKYFKGKEQQNKFLDHLKNAEFEKAKKSESAQQGMFGGKAHQAGNFISRNISGHNDQNDPATIRARFADKVQKADRMAQTKEQNSKEIKSGWDYIKKNLFSPRHVRDKVTGNFVTSDVPFGYLRKSTQDNARNASAESLRRSLNADTSALAKEKQHMVGGYSKQDKALQQQKTNLATQRQHTAKKADDKIHEKMEAKKEMMQAYKKKIAVEKKDGNSYKAGKLQQEQDKKAQAFDKELMQLRRDKDAKLAHVDRALARIPSQEQVNKEREAALKTMDNRIKNAAIDEKRDFFKNQLKGLARDDAQSQLNKAKSEYEKEKLLEAAKKDVQRIEKQQALDAKKQEEALEIKRQAVEEAELKVLKAQKKDLKAKEEAQKAQEEAQEEYNQAKEQKAADEAHRNEGVYNVMLEDEIYQQGEAKTLERQMMLIEAQERLKYLQEALKGKTDSKGDTDQSDNIEQEDDTTNPLRDYVDERYEADYLELDEEDQEGQSIDDSTINPLVSYLELEEESKKTQDEITDKALQEQQDALDQRNAAAQRQKEQLQQELQSTQMQKAFVASQLETASETQLHIKSELETNAELKADQARFEARQQEVDALETRKLELAKELAALEARNDLQEKTVTVHQASVIHEEKLQALLEAQEKFSKSQEAQKDSEAYQVQRSILVQEAKEATLALGLAEQQLALAQIHGSIKQREEVSEAIAVLEEGDIDKAKEMADDIDNRLTDIDNSLDSTQPDHHTDMTPKAGSKNVSADKTNYKVQQSQKLSRARLAQLNLTMSKAELQKLEAKKPEELTAADHAKISVLQQEVAKYENDYKKFEQEASDLNNRITSLDQDD